MHSSKTVREVIASTFRTGWAQIILVCAAVTVSCAVLYACLGWEVWFILAISAGAALYHFLLRLVIGRVTDCCMPENPNPSSFWFRQRRWEIKLYRMLRVKRWKHKLPTYFPENFSLERTAPEVILRHMCVAEVGHELNMVLGFGSLFLSFFTSDPLTYLWIFAATSAAAALVDGVFVVIQRYNRPRLRKLLKTQKQKET